MRFLAILPRMNMHPILAGVLNAIFPGLSYLLLRERVVFGATLFVAILLFMLVSFMDPSPAFDTVLFASSPRGRLLEAVSYALAFLAFGYDAYELARRKRAGSAVIKL